MCKNLEKTVKIFPNKSLKMNHFSDDIECLPWLEEIELSQYNATFLANFKSNQENFLSRSKLSRIRLQDFPAMNIHNFEHQKLLMNHIRITLQFEFGSPIRKQKVELLKSEKLDVFGEAGTGKICSAQVQKPPLIKLTSKPQHGVEDSENPAESARSSSRTKDKRSFDEIAWASIAKFRNGDKNVKQIENLRNGIIEVLLLFLYCGKI